MVFGQALHHEFVNFDDNVYVSPYPFSRTGELESPVYVFFRGGEEYERLVDEVERLRRVSLPRERLPKPLVGF